jgi:hypothetical protein
MDVQIKIYKKYLVFQLIFLSLVFSVFISCSFPSKGFILKSGYIINDLNFISNSIKNEYPKNTQIQSLLDIKNEELRKKLQEISVTSISIQYVTDDPMDFSSNFRDTRYDSTIIFIWEKSSQDGGIIKTMVYGFGNVSHLKPLYHDPDYQEISLNDSILLQKIRYQTVTVY